MIAIEDLSIQIQTALNSIRPHLQADGGDVELVEISNGCDVLLQLTGACGICDMSEMTMTAGIEETLRKSVPGLGKITALRNT